MQKLRLVKIATRPHVAEHVAQQTTHRALLVGRTELIMQLPNSLHTPLLRLTRRRWGVWTVFMNVVLFEMHHVRRQLILWLAVILASPPDEHHRIAVFREGLDHLIHPR